MIVRPLNFPGIFGIACVVAIAFFLPASPAEAQWRGYYTYPAYPAYPDPYYSPYSYAPAYPPRRSQTYGYAPDEDAYGSSRRGGTADDYDLGVNFNERTAAQVQNPTREPPGTIVIDTGSRHLYLVQADGSAIRYGIGVGRQGFEWKGTARVGRKSEWPRWIPPKDMLQRRPDLPEEMEGGIDNPLGARALYLYKGDKDTLFRIHGTNEPDTIGQAVSSGCIRMMNADVIDLYQRVGVGTRVVVL
ncbi:MAG TPA: L,D-transpeptidase [Methylocella sp.]|nr:L,D-transpeptidase [Methylocella sp.]